MENSPRGEGQRTRKRLWMGLGLGAATLALLWGVDAWLQRVATDSDAERAMRQVGQVAVLLRVAAAVVAAALGHVLLDWARQGARQGRWPPAGLDWPGQAAPLHGASAARMMRLIRVAGLVCWSLAVLLALWTAWTTLA